MNVSELLDLHQRGSAALRPFRGALRLLRPARLDRDAAADYDAMVAANPLVRRFPRDEQTRMRGELRQEKESTRRAAGSIARHHARQVRGIAARGRDVIARARRDVSLSLPDALDRIDANGMVMLALLRVQLMPLLRAAGPAELLGVYQSALQRKDARGYVECDIIEGLIATGAPLVNDDSERPASKQLREFVEDVQSERLPVDLPDFLALAAEADRLDSLADAIGLASIDPEQIPAAAAVYEQLSADLDTAAERSDTDDLAEVRKEAAAV